MLDTIQISSKDMIDSMEAIVAHLPSGAIRVGLEDPADLKGLATLLDKKFGVLIRSVGGELESQTKTVNKAQEKISKKQEELEKERIKRDDKHHDELVKSLRKKDESIGNFIQRNANLFINISKKFIDGLNKVVPQQLEYADTFMDLNRAGVQLQDGFRSLNGLATEAGQYYKDFAKNLVKLNPTLTKLNATIGNGVGLYSEQYKNLRQMGLSQEEANSAFEYAINQLAPAQLREMQAHNTLTQYIDKTTKSLIELKNATGKSVSIITTENELKGREARYTTWASNSKNKVSSQTLAELGLNTPEIMDYLLTGIPTSNIAMMMAGSPDNAMLLQELRRMLMSGQEINAQSVGQLQKKLRPIYNKSQQQRFNRAENPSIYAVAGHSDLSQTMFFTNLSEKLMQYGFDSKNNPNTEDNDLVQKRINSEDNINRMKNQISYAEAMGFAGIKSSVDTIEAATSNAEKYLQSISNLTSKIYNEIENTLGTTLTGIAGTIAMSGLVGFGPALKDWLLGKTMNVSSIIAGYILSGGTNGISNNSIFGNTGKNKVYRNKLGQYAKKPWWAKGKIGKVTRLASQTGKILGRTAQVGAALSLVNDAKNFGVDLLSNGVNNTYEMYKQQAMNGNLDFGDYMNPTKWMPILEGKFENALHYMFDKPAEEGISKVSSMNDEIINQNNRNAENVSEKLDKLIDCANGICKSLEDQQMYNKLQPTRSMQQSLVTGIS